MSIMIPAQFFQNLPETLNYMTEGVRKKGGWVRRIYVEKRVEEGRDRDRDRETLTVE